MTGWVLCGDALEVMARLPSDSVEAVVTDPPYGINFMSSKWDHGVPGAAFWCEALRVAKPGARLLAMGGTRTFHRLVCAIEDAGWRVMDTLLWMYGSGFPKSHDISKAIDKEAGAEREYTLRREVGGAVRKRDCAHGWKNSSDNSIDCPIPKTAAARQWDGWGTALKPAVELICMAMKPLDGTYAQNTLKHGCGGINVDGCRVATGDDLSGGQYGGAFSHSRKADGSLPEAIGSGSKGRWPPNVILSHTSDCKRTGTRKVKGEGGRTIAAQKEGASWFTRDAGERQKYHSADGTETVEAWECHPDCPVRMLDRQSGERPSAYPGRQDLANAYAGSEIPLGNSAVSFGNIRSGESRSDTGGASRFFYCAKASRAERTCGGTVDTRHPTVKPLALMRWLVRLVTPPGGCVLDPFAGSGTTGIAAHQEGFNYLLIDNDPESCDIARRRIAHWLC